MLALTCECPHCSLRCRWTSHHLCSYFRGMLEVTATEDASNSLCEHIDAADSGGAWYQAFIIARSDASIRVHFNGWASQVCPIPIEPSTIQLLTNCSPPSLIVR